MGLLDAIKRRATFLLPKIHFRLILLSRSSTKISKSVFYFYQLRLFFFSLQSFIAQGRSSSLLSALKCFIRYIILNFTLDTLQYSCFFHVSRCYLFWQTKKDEHKRKKIVIKLSIRQKSFSFFSCQHEGLTLESRNFFTSEKKSGEIYLNNNNNN